MIKEQTNFNTVYHSVEVERVNRALLVMGKLQKGMAIDPEDLELLSSVILEYGDVLIETERKELIDSMF